MIIQYFISPSITAICITDERFGTKLCCSDIGANVIVAFQINIIILNIGQQLLYRNLENLNDIISTSYRYRIDIETISKRCCLKFQGLQSIYQQRLIGMVNTTKKVISMFHNEIYPKHLTGPRRMMRYVELCISSTRSLHTIKYKIFSLIISMPIFIV